MNDWEIGVFTSWDEESAEWIQNGANRKAIVIGLVSDLLPANALYFPAPTLIHRQMALQKVGQLSAFSDVQVFSEEIKKIVFHAKLQAEMRLSELADLGIRNTRHLLQNGKSHLSKLSSIQNCFQELPAVVIGAGFSLQGLEETLQNLKGKALLIAAGSGLRKSPVEPDLCFIADPHTPLLRDRYPKTPLCIQGKVHPETLKEAPDTIFYVPDSTLPLEGWLMEEDFVFDGGWNGANGAVEVAHLLGCKPIYLAGVDLSYEDGKKYRDEEITSDRLVDFEGKKTQKDWVLAASWLREKQEEYQIFNLSNQGIKVAPFVKRPKLKSKMRPLPNAKPVRLREEKQVEWKISLENKSALAERLLLEPIWDAWKALFEIEGSDLNIQKDLFYERITKEHLEILKEEKITYYPNGQVKTIERFFGGQRDGETLLYWPNGKCKRRTVFKEGKRVTDEFWDFSGALLS